MLNSHFYFFKQNISLRKIDVYNSLIKVPISVKLAEVTIIFRTKRPRDESALFLTFTSLKLALMLR